MWRHSKFLIHVLVLKQKLISQPSNHVPWNIAPTFRRVIENLEGKRQDQHKCTRSGEQSTLDGCAAPVTSVCVTDSAEAFSISQLRRDLCHQNTFSNVLSHTVSVDSRCSCCHHLQYTRICRSGHTASSQQVPAVPGKQFHMCISEQKMLSTAGKSFLYLCTWVILLKTVTSGNCTRAPTSLERKCTAVPADRGRARPGTPWASYTPISASGERLLREQPCFLNTLTVSGRLKCCLFSFSRLNTLSIVSSTEGAGSMLVASCVPASLEVPLPSQCSFLWGAVEAQFCSSDILSFSSERQIAWQINKLELFSKEFPLTLLEKKKKPNTFLLLAYNYYHTTST